MANGKLLIVLKTVKILLTVFFSDERNKDNHMLKSSKERHESYRKNMSLMAKG